MSVASRFLRLSSRDRRFLVGALGLTALARVGLLFAPFRRVRAAAVHILPELSRTPSDTDLDRIGWAVVAASRSVPGTTCLVQALVAESLLRVTGHPCAVRFGVARDDRGRPEAHAWVQSGGRVVVGELDLQRYEVLRSAAEVR